jgi:acyl-CoA thioester hydrolase
MPAIFDWKHIVCDRDMDELGHANNISYLHWMQSAALAHSAAQGWPIEAYRQLGLGWVVRSHQIEYLTSALLGDEIIVQTSVANLKKVTSLRRFLILRAPDRTVLAKAATEWAFVDFSTGAPKRIPAEIAQAFEVVPETE